MPEDKKDVQPTEFNVYGYCVTYKKEGQWIIDQCDEYLNLPAHYPFCSEALDRVAYLRERGFDCRVAALLAEKSDTPEEFERNKINECETDPN
jgi:hypothetical protein